MLTSEMNAFRAFGCKNCPYIEYDKVYSEYRCVGRTLGVSLLHYVRECPRNGMTKKKYYEQLKEQKNE